MFSTYIDSYISPVHLSKPKTFAKYKRSSFFDLGHQRRKKSLMRLKPGVNFIKLFSFVADDEAK